MGLKEYPNRFSGPKKSARHSNNIARQRFGKSLAKGVSLALKGRLEEAVAELTQALEQALSTGDHRWARYFSVDIATLYDQMGDLKMARKYFRSALKYNTSDSQIHYLLGDVYERLGKTSLAQRHFARSYALAVKSNEKGLLEVFEHWKNRNRGQRL
jgi:tetratricopeptide (TPR) repeat protein